MNRLTTALCSPFATVFLFLLPLTTQAQCDCDFVVSLSAAEWQFDGAAHKVQPGDKICFAGGTRSGIRFMNIHGTADNPVIITNMCNSSVIIDAPSNYGSAIEIDNSSYFRFTGSGNPNIAHGIEITGAVMGLNIKSLSTDFEVDHINVHDTGCVGIVAKTDPTCDPKTWRGNYTMRNTSFHDNLISNTGCEGFYIGNSHYETGVTKNCDGSNIRVWEHDVVNVKVYNNKLRNIGNDGIQIGGAIAGCEVYYNTVENFGFLNNPYHVNGFQAGSGTHQAKVFGNVISNGNGYCFWDQGGGAIYYNNIAQGGLLGGFSLQDVAGTYAPTGFVVANNTIVNCGVFGIMNYSENPIESRIVNNIIVSGLPNYPFIKYNSSIARNRTIESNNLKTTAIADVKFQDTGQKNYRLKGGSPAINNGIDVRAWVSTDIDGVARPQGGAFDIGAYEFQEAVSKPVVNVGPDKTIILPASAITLSGNASVDNATISSYTWRKTAGGQAILSGENTPNLKVSGLVKGTYTFTLTVVDSNGSSATDEMNLIVKENPGPTANAGPNRRITLPTNSLSLIGSGASSVGKIVSYQWRKVSGGIATLTNANASELVVSDLIAGKYIFELAVRDQYGATASDRTLVVVESTTTLSFTANAGPNVIVSEPKSSVVISGGGASPYGIVSYEWTKVSGGIIILANANTSTLTVSGFGLGKYIFMLTVKDKAGRVATDKMLLRVEESAFAEISPSASRLNAIYSGSSDVEDETDEVTTLGLTNENEEGFTFMDKHYPGGYHYEVTIFEHSGKRIFQGTWELSRYDETIQPGKLYLYQVWQNGRRIDTGKILRTQ